MFIHMQLLNMVLLFTEMITTVKLKVAVYQLAHASNWKHYLALDISFTVKVISPTQQAITASTHSVYYVPIQWYSRMWIADIL